MTVEFYSDGFPRMHTVLPDGVCSGNVRVVHLTPSERTAQFSMLRSMFCGRGTVLAGETICQIYAGKTLWMSDTRDERADHWKAKSMARGHVLIGGLGLGMFALVCALKPEVDRVTVVELNSDVIDLVLSHLQAAMQDCEVDTDKLDVIEADVLEWVPPKGMVFDTVWFDIWSSLCLDNLPEYQKLNRRFGRKTRVWRGCWGEQILKKARRNRFR